MTTEFCKTDTDSARREAVAKAVGLLARGELVALPTETVYGLAADATNAEAVAKIFEAKERPFFDPLIVHLPSLDWLDRLTQDRDPLAEKLAAKFWPGPLTFVLPRRAIVPDLVTSGLPTVAVRMSAHPIFREVCAQFGKPLAAPSANRFGRISPTAAEHVVAELGGRIPLIVDGGATSFGLESTIVAVEGGQIRILRSGPVTAEQLVETWIEWRRTGHRPLNQEEIDSFCGRLFTEKNGKPEAPGQLASHYAPRTRLRIADFRFESLAVAAHPLQQISDCANLRVGLLAWNPPADLARFAAVELLSPGHDLREAATRLFAAMRRLDEAGLDLIVAEPVPEVGLGLAIMDRLRKAAAGNDE